MRFMANAWLVVLAMKLIACGSAPQKTEAVVVRNPEDSLPTNVYPYLVSDAYPRSDVDVDLGHGVRIALVEEVGPGLVKVYRPHGSVSKEALVALHSEAVQHLVVMARDRIKIAMLNDGPQGKPFVLVGGDWAAATCILLPRLAQITGEALGTQELCASIPHRDAMLVFAKGDKSYRDAMRALVLEKESDGRKPLTYELFEITGGTIQPFTEQ
jgi:hypothetical protein